MFAIATNTPLPSPLNELPAGAAAERRPVRIGVLTQERRRRGGEAIGVRPEVDVRDGGLRHDRLGTADVGLNQGVEVQSRLVAVPVDVARERVVTRPAAGNDHVLIE